MEVFLAPFSVLQGHTIGILHGDMGFIFANDPALVVALHKPLGDTMKIEFAGSHLRPWLRSVAGEVLVMNVIHDVATYSASR